jgi:transcriptional regulator, AraC family
MEWVERLNQSMNYIEEHLTDEIDYEQLGRIACCSAYHYQRMFTYMAGITLAEYIHGACEVPHAAGGHDGKLHLSGQLHPDHGRLRGGHCLDGG